MIPGSYKGISVLIVLLAYASLLISSLLQENLEIMDRQILLDELLALALEMNLEVRKAFLDGQGGGLCRLKGKWVLFVDEAASIDERIGVVAESLADRPELENIYLMPQVREAIEKCQGQ